MVWRQQRLSALARRGLLASLLIVPIMSSAVPPADAQQADAPASQTSRACSQVPDHFGRLFGGLPGARWSSADVDLLAGKVMAQEETQPTPEGQVDDEE